MPTVAVVILNYNGRKHLEKYLPSVVKYTDTELIIADNNSTDGSVEFLQKNYPDLRLIQNGENGGFSKGYNMAFEHVQADIYVLLNSDIEVTENWLKQPIQILESSDKIAAVQSKIRSDPYPEKFDHAGAGGGFIDKWGYPFCRGRLFDIAEEDKGQYDDSCEIFWASGACLFIKSKLYKEFGGLDDEFFAHMEEIDLCWRMKNAGYEIWYAPESVVHHLGGGTLSRSNPRKTFLNFRNGLVLLYKNLKKGSVFRIILWRMIMDGVAGFAFLVSGKPKHTWAVVRAHWSFFGNMSKWRKARKLAQSTAKVFNHPQIYRRSIVWNFFLGKKRKYSDLKP